jgi:electron transfer flavoprotein alpha subunit
MSDGMLILLEHDRGTLSEAAFEALTAGRRLAADLDVPVEAVLVVGPDDEPAVEPMTADAGAYGAETVHVVSDPILADYGPDAWATAFAALAEEIDADVLMTCGTDRGNEVLAHLAARADEPFVANCLVVDSSDDDSWTITRVQWGGSLLEDVSLAAETKLVTFAHHGVPAEPVTESVEPTVETFEPDLDPSVAVTMVQDRDVLSQGVTLSTAPVVVSGGRGVGSPEGFGVLEELAELLGGVVGCSRAVTNNGWRSHTDQVGQTGTRIAPEIYIAAGISGAIQHWVGAMASKQILAINTDPEANMVTRADYAVLADLHEVIPAITAEIRRRRT